MSHVVPVRAIVLDIEGTTSSLAFVKEELFPYARRRLPAYVHEHEADLAEILGKVREIEHGPSLGTEALIGTLLGWMDADCKATPLKSLQGRIWQEGYERGEIRGHVYADAVRALRAWSASGIELYVYSSGSVLAQRLLFAHSEHGDLTPLLRGHFDTTIGGKLEVESYTAIAARIGLPPDAILFLSDHAGEISAAAIAGMQVIRVDRSTIGVPAADPTRIGSFDELVPRSARDLATPAPAPSGYRTLSAQSAADYVAGHPALAAKLGGETRNWATREVGDGNLNLIYVLEGPAGGLVIKQALPYVRLVGKGWPLEVSRSHYERLALEEQARWASAFVPAVYHADAQLGLIVMQYLAPHIVLRKELVRGQAHPLAGVHLGTFLARTLYHTSDLHVGADAHRRRIAVFLGNTAMCRISEDLIFDEPYFAATLNRHTSPGLDDVAVAFRRDVRLKLAVQELKYRFLHCAEALLHGDLHTGSVMVTATDTRVIDPEFAFYGPMGFDIGAIMGNYLLAYFAQPGHERQAGERAAFAASLLGQLRLIWATFSDEFAGLWRLRSPAMPGGDAWPPRLVADAPELLERSISARLLAIWRDSVGFAACKMIRRILGLAHIEDFEAIGDLEVRAACERRALRFARSLLLEHDRYPDVAALVHSAGETP